MEEHILALDASTKRTGFAIRKSKDEVVQYGVIVSASQSLEKRITIMRDGVLKLIKENNIDTIVIEDVRQDGFSTQTARALLWLQGCLSVAVWEYNPKIKIKKIGPSSWRKVLGIKQGRGVTRDIQKQLDIEYAATAIHETLTAAQDDEADSICILLAYLKDADGLALPQHATSLPPIGSEESAF